MKEQNEWQNPSIDQLLKKIYTFISLKVLPIILIFTISPTFTSAEPLEEISERENSSIENIIVDTSKENQKIDSTEMGDPESKVSAGNYPDLGDAQVFPFVAGLDSYE